MHGHDASRSPGESEPRKPFFPNAKFLFQRKEVDTFALAAPDAVGLVRRRAGWTT